MMRYAADTQEVRKAEAAHLQHDGCIREDCPTLIRAWTNYDRSVIDDYIQGDGLIRISDLDRVHMQSVLIDGTWWSARLLQLIAKSDREHRAALRRAFPSYVEAYEAWHDAPLTREAR